MFPILMDYTKEQLDEMDDGLFQERKYICMQERKVCAIRIYHILKASFNETTSIKVSFNEDEYNNKLVEVYVKGSHDDLSDTVGGYLCDHIWKTLESSSITFLCNEEGLTEMTKFILNDPLEHKKWMTEIFEHKLQNQLQQKSSNNQHKTKV